MRIAVLMHLFYHDLWEELSSYVDNLRVPFTKVRLPFDLYVNLVEGNPANSRLAESIRKRFPHARIQVSPNQGRDIGGFLRLIDAVLQSGRSYNSLILMHSKKTVRQPPQNGIGWRKTLLGCLLGSRRRATKLALSFLTDRRLGMVGSGDWLFNEENRPDLVYSNNRPIIEEYCRRFGLEKATTDFIAGTMFWARAKPFLGFFARHNPLAIAAELETGDHYDDDRPTRTHALERIFGYLITAQGYRIRGLDMPPQCVARSA